MPLDLSHLEILQHMFDGQEEKSVIYRHHRILAFGLVFFFGLFGSFVDRQCIIGNIDGFSRFSVHLIKNMHSVAASNYL